MQRQYENTQGNGAFRADVYLTHSRKSQTACQEFDFQEFYGMQTEINECFFFYIVWYILKQLFISVSVKEGLNWVMTFTAKGLKFWLFYTASSDAKWPINDGKHFKVNFWYD